MGEKFSSPPPIGGLTKHPYIILDRITESQTLEVDNKTRVIRYNQIRKDVRGFSLPRQDAALSPRSASRWLGSIPINFRIHYMNDMNFWKH